MADGSLRGLEPSANLPNRRHDFASDGQGTKGTKPKLQSYEAPIPKPEGIARALQLLEANPLAGGKGLNPRAEGQNPPPIRRTQRVSAVSAFGI